MPYIIHHENVDIMLVLINTYVGSCLDSLSEFRRANGKTMNKILRYYACPKLLGSKLRCTVDKYIIKDVFQLKEYDYFADDYEPSSFNYSILIE